MMHSALYRGELMHARHDDVAKRAFRYVLGPAHRLAGARARFRHVRELFVSPFLHGEVTYDFDFAVPLDGDELAIGMHVRDTRGHQVFYASFSGTRAPVSRAVSARVSPRSVAPRWTNISIASVSPSSGASNQKSYVAAPCRNGDTNSSRT